MAGKQKVIRKLFQMQEVHNILGTEVLRMYGVQSWKDTTVQMLFSNGPSGTPAQIRVEVSYTPVEEASGEEK